MYDLNRIIEDCDRMADSDYTPPEGWMNEQNFRHLAALVRDLALELRQRTEQQRLV